MNIGAISDMHGQFPIMPKLHDQKIDLLLIPGDILSGNRDLVQAHESMKKFLKWVKDIDAKNTVITPGNHDFWNRDLIEFPKNVHCLIDEWIDIDGLIIHGTPWTPTFSDWAWMKNDSQLKPHWENIDQDTNILINHGPAFGICDMLPKSFGPEVHLGSKTLLDELYVRDLDYVLTGHIHQANHDFERISDSHKTQLACCSLVNERLTPIFEPKIFKI